MKKIYITPETLTITTSTLILLSGSVEGIGIDPSKENEVEEGWTKQHKDWADNIWDEHDKDYWN